MFFPRALTIRERLDLFDKLTKYDIEDENDVQRIIYELIPNYFEIVL